MDTNVTVNNEKNKTIEIKLDENQGIVLNVSEDLNIIEIIGALEISLLDVKKKLFIDNYINIINNSIKEIKEIKFDKNNPLYKLAEKLI